MKNMSIKLKMLMLMLIGLVGIVFAVIMGINKINQGEAALESFIEKAIVPSEKIKKLEEDISWTFNNLTHVISEFTMTNHSDAKMLEKIEAIDKGFENLTEDVFIQNQKTIDSMKQNWSKVKQIIKAQILPAYEDEDIDMISEIGQMEFAGPYFAIIKDLKVLMPKVNNSYEQIIESTKSQFATSMTLTLVGASALILFYLVLTLVISKTINRSLRNFQEGLLGFFKYLNKETSEVKPLKADSTDEIGEMAKVVNENIIKTKTLIESDNKFLNEVSSMVNEVNKGYLFNRFENRVENNETLEKLRTDFNEMLENLQKNIAGSTNKILDVLVSFGKLDFTNGIKNDDGKIAIALNEVNKLITDMLVENKSNGLTLGNSSKVLLDNVNLLNKNSNEAATSLEETAAALEQITENISNNTTNVVKMSGFAENLTNSANEGQNLAKQTTTSMDEINAQVTAINEAITVIDQIAFQTNILSLNAAVEAATAGEAGKGFAVVAGEVRNLAARSAEAASEIKTLVENATSKANNGKNIADKMIEGYTGLNDNISKTLELISDVESASKEQLSGIEQINDAVSSLDQQTQQNAMIASQTYDVAMQTDEIAKLVVANVNEKEFIGKEQVQAKTFAKKVAVKREIEPSPKPQRVMKTPSTSSKKFVSDSSDEWESF